MMMFEFLLVLVVGFGLVLLLGIGAAIIYAFGRRPGFNLLRQGPFSPKDSTSPTPLELLQVRYARGELSKAEYEELRQDLES